MVWAAGCAVLALSLGWLSEMLRRHAAERRLDLLTLRSEAARTARAEAYIDTFDRAVKRYEGTISAYHQRHRMVASPERDAIACAQGDLDRLRDAWAEDRPGR